MLPEGAAERQHETVRVWHGKSQLSGLSSPWNSNESLLINSFLAWKKMTAMYLLFLRIVTWNTLHELYMLTFEVGYGPQFSYKEAGPDTLRVLPKVFSCERAGSEFEAAHHCTLSVGRWHRHPWTIWITSQWSQMGSRWPGKEEQKRRPGGDRDLLRGYFWVSIESGHPGGGAGRNDLSFTDVLGCLSWDLRWGSLGLRTGDVTMRSLTIRIESL